MLATTTYTYHFCYANLCITQCAQCHSNVYIQQSIIQIQKSDNLHESILVYMYTVLTIITHVACLSSPPHIDNLYSEVVYYTVPAWRSSLSMKLQLPCVVYSVAGCSSVLNSNKLLGSVNWCVK